MADNKIQVEGSEYVEPAFNIGQKVVWVCGAQFLVGTEHIITEIVKSSPYNGKDRWFVRLDGKPTDYFPGRVKAYRP